MSQKGNLLAYQKLPYHIEVNMSTSSMIKFKHNYTILILEFSHLGQLIGSLRPSGQESRRIKT